jgi:hypothetical protein
LFYPNIALLGLPRSGKDTAADTLVTELFYERVAFADPLKEMALEIDPWITYTFDSEINAGIHAVRLSTLIEHVGWEHAKDEYPEVRRILQHVGQSIRKRDPDYWLRIGLTALEGVAARGFPAVVTDCRYPNEAEALRERAFMFIRIERPSANAPSHESDTALADYPTDGVIQNTGSLASLRRSILRAADADR